MAGKKTIAFMQAYFQVAATVAYFSGMFKVRPGNIYAGEEIELDITRSGEDVAPVITDMRTGYHLNASDIYTSKGFIAPVHKEAIVINSQQLLKRVAGENPYKDPRYRAGIIKLMFDGMRKNEALIRRAMELQASQVLQEGKIAMLDENGLTAYTLDFQPKATHFPTASTSWATATLAQKISDLEALCNVVRKDHLARVDRLTLGSSVVENLLQTDGFLDRFDTQRADLGTITSASTTGEGGIYRGALSIGQYKVDIFTYDGQYKHPSTGVITEFMHPGKIVAQASNARLDACFGNIPNIGVELGINGARVLPELPTRFASQAHAMDMHTNVWLSPDGENMFGGVGARPLMVPTAIDSFACLNTQLT